MERIQEGAEMTEKLIIFSALVLFVLISYCSYLLLKSIQDLGNLCCKLAEIVCLSVNDKNEKRTK